MPITEDIKEVNKYLKRHRKTYPKVKPGEWIQPIRKGYKMVCCDCGLVHSLDFRIYKRRIQFRAFRDERRTGQIRRWRKYESNNR